MLGTGAARGAARHMRQRAPARKVRTTPLCRQYCSRRIARLRRRGDVKLVQRSGKKFAPRPVSATNAKCSEALLLQLMLAERAWGHSQQLIAEVADVGPRAQHHAVRRLRKAVKEAATLSEVVEEVGDARSQLEARAYWRLQAGWLAVEEEMWDDALKHLTTASRLLLQVQESGTSLHQRAVTQRLEAITPTLRLCEYSLDRAFGAGTAQAVLQELAAEEDATRASPEQAAALAGMLAGAGTTAHSTASAADGSVAVTWAETSHKITHGKFSSTLDKAAMSLAAFLEDTGAAADSAYVQALTHLDDARRIADKEGSAPQWQAALLGLLLVKLQVQLAHGCGLAKAQLLEPCAPVLIAPGPHTAGATRQQVERARALLQRLGGVLTELGAALAGAGAGTGSGEGATDPALPAAPDSLLALHAARQAGVSALATACTAMGYVHESGLAPNDAVLAAQADALVGAAAPALSAAASAIAKVSAAGVDGLCSLVPQQTAQLLVAAEGALLSSTALSSMSDAVGRLGHLHRGRMALTRAGGALPASTGPAPEALRAVAEPAFAKAASARGPLQQSRCVLDCHTGGTHAQPWLALLDSEVLAHRYGLPALQPVHMKPVTFDVAHDFVQPHDISHRLPQAQPGSAAAAEQPPTPDAPAPAPAEATSSVGGLLSWFTG